MTRILKASKIVFMDTIENDSAPTGAGKTTEAARALQFGGYISPTHPEAQAMGARIKLARGELSQKQMAELVGVHFNTIGKVEKGHSPDAKLLLSIAKAVNVNPAWLLIGDAFPMAGYIPPASSAPVEPPSTPVPTSTTEAAALVPRSVTAQESGAYVYVPHFDIHASAGPGFFNDVENVVAMRPFERGYIRNKLGIAHNELALVNIIGRSMEPLLHSGDVSMLDLRDREASVEGVHVIRIDGALMVKGLQRRPGRVLRVTSRNQDFEGFDITPDEDNQRDFEILGRLRWAGITLH
ncbi:XRE family transcriptional regulator [Variovorax gossypii]